MPGLREQKKQLTRESIADAALRLGAEKGLDHLTIEEIAKEAFVSPRTFSNYFSCKEEAVAAAGSQAMTRIAADLAGRPEDEPPLRSLAEVLVHYAMALTEEQLDLNLRKLELERSHPSLHPYLIAQYDTLERTLSDIIAERAGTTSDAELYPGLVAAAAVSAIKSGMRIWSRASEQTDSLPELIEQGFELIAQGLPETLPRENGHA